MQQDMQYVSIHVRQQVVSMYYNIHKNKKQILMTALVTVNHLPDPTPHGHLALPLKDACLLLVRTSNRFERVC